MSEGIYGTIRQPIDAALWLTVIAQGLMLDDWFVGPSGVAALLPMYLTRAPAEGRMMLDPFGDAYRAYMGRTGASYGTLDGDRPPIAADRYR